MPTEQMAVLEAGPLITMGLRVLEMLRPHRRMGAMALLLILFKVIMVGAWFRTIILTLDAVEAVPMV
jgi:hypothetical protein